MNESIVLGYWGIRGRRQVPRHLLCYTKADFTEKKYASQDQWKGIGKDSKHIRTFLSKLTIFNTRRF